MQLKCGFMKHIISISIFLFCSIISFPAFSKRKNKPGKDEFVVPALQTIDVIVYLDDTYTVISGAGLGGQVDCFIYGPEKILVSYDVNPGSNCSMKFTPKVSGKFIIKFVNYDNYSSEYVVMTN